MRDGTLGAVALVSLCGLIAASHAVFDNLLFIRFACVEFCHDAMAGHYQDMIGDFQYLVNVARDKYDSSVRLLDKAVYEIIDFLSGSDINAHGGLIENHDLAICLQPLSEHHFLFISTT